MQKLLLLGISLLSARLACGQLDPNTITIAASTNVTVAPDQVVFSLSLTTPLATDLDQVVAALAPLGVTAADLQSAYPPFGNAVTLPGGALPGPTVVWTFTLSAPFASLNSTLNSLLKFQANNSSLPFSFTLAGSPASPQALAAQQCPLSALLANAQSQAQQVAATAGLTVGPVLALSNLIQQSPGLLLAPAYFARAEFTTAIVNPPVMCSIVVKFALVGH
jgi:uncharacterized protein YggE